MIAQWVICLKEKLVKLQCLDATVQKELLEILSDSWEVHNFHVNKTSTEKFCSPTTNPDKGLTKLDGNRLVA